MISHILTRLSSFADYQMLGYSNENIRLIMDSFHDVEVVPSMVPEYVHYGNPLPRIQLASLRIPFFITILTQRIDISVVAVNKDGFSEDERMQQKQNLPKYLASMLNLFSAKAPLANRLAWFNTYMYFDIDDNKKMEFKNRFLKETDFFSQHATDDFSARFSSREECVQLHEELNVLMSVNRISTYNPPNILVDGYKIDFDINTLQENQRNRFQGKDCGSFVDAASAYQDTLEGDFINEYR